MSRFLVTGGCGFIGSHLVDALLASGHSAVVVDDLSTGRKANLAPGAELVVADIVDSAKWLPFVGSVDGAYHLAAVASVERSNQHWVESHRTNLTGTLAVFAALRDMPGRPPVVYASSAAVYGEQAVQPIVEDSPLDPLSPYGVDKRACEMHARVAQPLFGLSSAGMRFFNVYGPRQDPSSPYSGVISIFLDRLAANRSVVLHGDGSSTRDFVYVEDVAVAMTGAMDLLRAQTQSHAHVVNVCTGRATRIDRLLGIAARIMGREAMLEYGPQRAGDIQASIGSPDRLRTMLGAGCDTSLERGLRATADSLRGESASRKEGAAT